MATLSQPLIATEPLSLAIAMQRKQWIKGLWDKLTRFDLPIKFATDHPPDAGQRKIWVQSRRPCSSPWWSQFGNLAANSGPIAQPPVCSAFYPALDFVRAVAYADWLGAVGIWSATGRCHLGRARVDKHAEEKHNCPICGTIVPHCGVSIEIDGSPLT